MTLPPAFDAWFGRATALDPADRFQVATVAVRALARCGVPLPTGATQPPPWASSPDATSVLTPAPGASSPAMASRPQATPGGTWLLPTASSQTPTPGATAPQTQTARLAGIALTLAIGVVLGAGAYAVHTSRANGSATGTDAPAAPPRKKRYTRD